MVRIEAKPAYVFHAAGFVIYLSFDNRNCFSNDKVLTLKSRDSMFKRQQPDVFECLHVLHM